VASLPMVGYTILALVVISCAAIALRMQNLVIAAAALGIGSAALAMLFFFMNAPYAGGFELSVGAGLVSVLFLVAISVATTQRTESTSPQETARPVAPAVPQDGREECTTDEA
jgi:NADH:ubiquinone oxidoreductase subunit 6 (subunit J)